jgi:hypothetical protein
LDGVDFVVGAAEESDEVVGLVLGELFAAVEDPFGGGAVLAPASAGDDGPEAPPVSVGCELFGAGPEFVP